MTKKLLKRILKVSGLGILVFLIVFIYNISKAQDKPVLPQVNYINNIPIIDGFLDDNLQLLPIRKLNKKIDIFLFKSLKNANFRMAYTVDNLYLYVEAYADSFICRDRGYQNGDGLIFLLADGTHGKKFTDDFYVYGFSSQTIEEQKWAEKVLWYKDNNVELRRLPDDVQIKYASHDGIISFEILLPWNSAYPYHPWSEMVIGTNLWMVKAFENKNFPIIKALFLDFKLPSESNGRKYKPLLFENPKENVEQLYWVLNRNNYLENESIQVDFLNNTKKEVLNKDVNIIIKNNDNDLIYNSTHKIEYDKERKMNFISFKLPKIIAGTYNLSVESININKNKVAFTIFPSINVKKLRDELNSIKEKITTGDFNTLMFYIQGIENSLKNLDRYNTYSSLVKEIEYTMNLISEYLQSNQSLNMVSVDHRRAFISEIDNVLQPYSIKLPKDYDPKKSYPLLVFLHGSGRNDLNALKYHDYILQDDFICIAPNGRGVSNYYGTSESQKDINEAIDDVIKNFNVDTSNIVLSGFSMGGYGVYRTYYENSKRYKALAIIAGEPNINLIHKMQKGDFPNFLKRKNSKKFLNIPIFIYHGVHDMNCPYPSTKKVIENLEEMNANLTKFISTDYGHSIPTSEGFSIKFREWIVANTQK